MAAWCGGLEVLCDFDGAGVSAYWCESGYCDGLFVYDL